MNFIPTLQNFKDLLGNVNDGNVVFKEDESGLEKVNHGNAISRKIHNYRQVASNPDDNMRIRNALIYAITNSSEGKALEEDQLIEICSMIGCGNEKQFKADLTRKELKAVLDRVELLVRGENPVPARGRTRASIKDIPVLENNKLVKEQIARLKSVGYDPKRYTNLFEIAKKQTRVVSSLFDGDHLDKIFAKGFEGHTKKEMVLFVRNSAAHIQSQIFDMIFWLGVDTLEDPTAPKNGYILFSPGRPEEVLRRVVLQMTKKFAEGKDPLPKTAVLPDFVTDPKTHKVFEVKAPAEEVEIPEPEFDNGDEQLAAAGSVDLKPMGRELFAFVYDPKEGVVAKYQDLVKLLSSDEVGFTSRRLKNIVSQLAAKVNAEMATIKTADLVNELYGVYTKAFTQSTAKDAVGKQNDARKAAQDFIKATTKGLPVIDLLGNFPAKVLAACRAKPDLAKHFQADFLRVLDGLSVGGGHEFGDVKLASVVGSTLNRFGELFGVEPLARALMNNFGYDMTLHADKFRKIVSALTDATGSFGEMVHSLRTMQATKALDGSNGNIDQIAQRIVNTYGDFAEVAKGILGADIDKKAVDEAKNNLFTQAADLKTTYGTLVYKEAIQVYDKDSRDKARKDIDDKVTKAEKDLKASEVSLETLNTELATMNSQEPRDEQKIQEKMREIVDQIETVKYNDFVLKGFQQAKTDFNNRYDDKYLDIVTNPVFRGKLALVSQCWLLDDRPDVKAKLYDYGGARYVITPENVDLAKSVLDEVFADKTLSDIKTMMGYINEGYSQEDFMFYAANSRKGKGNIHLYRDMYFDGQLQFPDVDPVPRQFLLDSINVAVKKNHSGDSDSYEQELTPDTYLTDDLFDAFYAEFRAGLKPEIEKKNAGNSEAVKNVLENAGISNDKHGKGDKEFLKVAANSHVETMSTYLFRSIWGFGTDDPKTLRNALLRVGLTQKDLNKPAGWLKAYRLSIVIKLHGDKIDGAVEWAERMTGKAFDEIRFGDLFKLSVPYEISKPFDDPLDKLNGDYATIAKFLDGRYTIAEAKLKPADMPVLINGLRSLASGAESVEVKLFDKAFTVSVAPNGALTAKLRLDGDKTMSVAVARPLAELIAQIENQVVDHAKDYEADQLLGVLPEPPKGFDPISRPRELCSRVLATLLELPSVNFAHLSTKDLYATVSVALNPETDRAALVKRFATPPTSYNSAETVELQAKYLKTDETTRLLVKLPKKEDRRNPEARAFDFVAELVMNADTWAYDVGMKDKGSRLATLIAANKDQIAYLKENPNVIQNLPEFLREGVGGILVEIIGASEKEGPDLKTACAGLEDEIDAFVQAMVREMQGYAAELFKLSHSDKGESWRKSLDEMSGGGTDGLSAETSQGRFTKKLLDNYFVSCDPTEKRSMIANVLRNTNKDSSRGKLVGELLKGAGPLLQKTLQGLSENTFGPETRLALKDMKSRLLPIPDCVIQAQLMELVRSSNGEILSVEVKKSLGQATVGQALLCHILTKDHPVSGEDVVIKLIRPNVQTAVQREYKVFLDIAKKLDEDEGSGTSQQDAFKARYQTVLKEFDFTLEAANIDLCKGIYDAPTAHFGDHADAIKTEKYDKVHSMDRHHSVSPMTGMLVVKKVDGEPLDRLLENSRTEVDAILGDIKVVTQLGKDVKMKKTVYEAKSYAEMLTAKTKLLVKRNELDAKRGSLVKLVDIWFEKALFGDGVFHNDLHPGNVMVNGTDVSVIDFGNVARLSPKQQTAFVFIFSAAMNGSVDDFVAGIETLLGGDGIGKEKLGDLKAVLSDIFAKGSYEDALPRMLAAFSTLKNNLIEIPEVVYNFTESISRIQAVIDGIADEIEEIETISDAMVMANDDLVELKLDKEKFFTGPNAMTKFGDLVDGVNAVLRSLGTKESKFDPAAGVKAGKSVLANYFSASKDANEEAIVNGLLEEFKKKVFCEEDGGVESVKAIIASFGEILHPSLGFGQGIDANTQFKLVRSQVEDQLKLYEIARRGGSTKAVAEQQKNLVISIRDGFLRVVDCFWIPRLPGTGPIIRSHVKSIHFVDSVANSIMRREWAILLRMANYKEINQDKFTEVYSKVMNKEYGSALVKIGIGADSGKYSNLMLIGKKLSAENDSKSNADKYFKIFEDQLQPNQVSSQDVKKLRRLAWDFRFPGSWKLTRTYPTALALLALSDGEKYVDFYTRGKKRIEERSVEELRNVFQENLNALKKALKTETPTEAQIKYFAQLVAATTRGLSFGDTFRQYDKQKLNEIAGGSDEIKTFLTAYKEATETIIVEEEKAAAAEKEAKQKK